MKLVSLIRASRNRCRDLENFHTWKQCSSLRCCQISKRYIIPLKTNFQNGHKGWKAWQFSVCFYACFNYSEFSEAIIWYRVPASLYLWKWTKMRNYIWNNKVEAQWFRSASHSQPQPTIGANIHSLLCLSLHTLMVLCDTYSSVYD